MSANSNVLEVLVLLAGKGGLSGRYLEEHLGVDRRTVRNYIEALNAAGFTITATRGKHSRYVLHDKHPLAGLQLTKEELEALNAAHELLRCERGYAYEETFRQLLTKARLHCRQLSEAEPIPTADNTTSDPMRERSQKWLQLIHRAIHENRKLKMTYHAAGRNAASERTVCPYGLYNADDENYLLAYCEEKRAVREFNIKRIQDLAMQKEYFSKSSRVSVKEYFQNSIGAFGGEAFEVKLLIRPPFAQPIMEKKLVKSQKTQVQADGRILFEARLSGRPDVVRWILGMGEHCTVVEPEDLREEVAGALKRAVQGYEYAQ